MTTYWKKLAAIGFLLFLVLWAAGIVYTFTLTQPQVHVPVIASMGSGGESRSDTRTTSNLAQIGLDKAPLPQVLDQENVDQVQVYEKTAHASSSSTAFAEDEQRARNAIAAHKAVIFSEKTTGIAPERWLVLGVGVRPDRFDSLLDELTQIGQIRSFDLQQQDRTSEFRRLHAQRQSLKKYQEAIVKLRKISKLSVEEALKLEQKAMEVDKEIQAVGVQLGELLGKEPSYNLFLTLRELEPGSWQDRSFTLPRRLVEGFLWALGWWLLVAALGAGIIVAVFVSIKTLRAPVGPSG